LELAIQDKRAAGSADNHLLFLKTNHRSSQKEYNKSSRTIHIKLKTTLLKSYHKSDKGQPLDDWNRFYSLDPTPDIDYK
jgi:hypothetical protein